MSLLNEPDLAFDFNGTLPPLPQAAAVFVIHMRQGNPYMAKTALLRQRLHRLLGERSTPSRLIDLRAIASRVEIWYTRARLEQALLSYSLARAYFPDTYRKQLRLATPPYIKVILGNQFPRTQVTSRLSGKENLFFGPFRNRAEAERWEAQMLEMFQFRRCEEDLDPSPEHPGCIYGEMNQCLRPCQLIVGPTEYASEVSKLTTFLESQGASLKDAVEKARDRASEHLDFEEAARQHRRLEKVDAMLRLTSDITTDIRHANGVSAVKRDGGATLYFLLEGLWQAPVRLDLAMQAGESMDRRLREIVDQFPSPKPTLKDREEHLGILSRWFASSWRDSEWLPFPSRAELPYRKLVRLISRAAAHENMNLYDAPNA
jgi:excinuclease UvrABC nuclease subunit